MKPMLAFVCLGVLIILFPSCCWKGNLKRCSICSESIEKIADIQEIETNDEIIDFD